MDIYLPEYKEMQLSDWGRVLAAYASCHGERPLHEGSEQGNADLHRHAQTCPLCRHWMECRLDLADRSMASDGDLARMKTAWNEGGQTKTLLDFIAEYPGVDYGRITAAYISCTGHREADIYAIHDHVQRCFCCQDWMASQLYMDERCQLSPVDMQRIAEQMTKRENEMRAESFERENRLEEAESYRSGAYGI